MEKIYAAPINADYYAVFVGDKKLTLPLSESDAKKIADRYNGFAELQQANKALSLQVEILSGAYETSRKRVKELEAKNKALVSRVDFVRTAFDGLKQLLGTEKDATTANFKVKELEAAIANSSEKEKSLMVEREELVETLVEARLQIEYLEGKFGKTGTGTAAISRIERLTGKYKI